MLKKRERELLNMGRGSGFAVTGMESRDRSLAMRMEAYGWLKHLYRDGGFHLELTGRGLVELRRPAPPPKPGRIQCVNPICAASALQEKHPGCDAIICGPCFKMTGDLRTEYRALRARWNKVERLQLKRGRDTTALAILERRMDENWQAIVRFFTAPEKPEGLDTFLAEMGWTHDSDQQQPVGPEEL